MFSKNNEIFGRGERIRTSGPCLPKTVLYQAELLPDRLQIRGCRRLSARQARDIGSVPPCGKPEKARWAVCIPQQSDALRLGETGVAG